MRRPCCSIALTLLVLSGASTVAHAEAGPPTPGASAPDAPVGPIEAGPLPAAPPDDHRLASLVGLGSVYTGMTVWSYFAWYYDKPALPEFTVGGDGYFGEGTYAGGADKVGHFWANLAMARGTTELLRWGGWRPLPASAIASSLAWAFFFYVEIKDGFYYQLSPGDMIANTLGAATSMLMVNVPRVDELIDFRVEYWPSDEYLAALGDGDVNIAEDYSGQTYLAALHVGELGGLGRGRWTGWTRFVDVTVGFGTDKYKPDPPPMPEVIRHQHLFVGLSLNLQGVVEAVLADRGAQGTARAFGHGVFEVLNAPFTSLPVLDSSRSPDR